MNTKRNRPFGITLLALLVLSIVAMSGFRLYAAVQFWSTLIEYNARAGPLYIALTSGYWIVAGIVLLWAIWCRFFWAYPAIIAGLILYTIWYWLDRLLFQYPRPNWPFMLGLTGAAVLLTCTLLLLPSSKRYFRES